MVGAQPFQTLVQKPERSVAAPVVGLGGKENLTTTFAESKPVIIQAAGVGRGSVTVVHTLIERAIDNGNRLGCAAVSPRTPSPPRANCVTS